MQSILWRISGIYYFIHQDCYHWLVLIVLNDHKFVQWGPFHHVTKIDWKIPDPRLKDPEIQVHALWDQNLPIGQEFEISIETFLGHFTSLSILIHWLFWPISGLYVVTCPPHLPSETAHRASCRTRNYKYCIMLHPYPTLIIRIHYGDILNRQFDQNIENSYATISLNGKKYFPFIYLSTLHTINSCSYYPLWFYIHNYINFSNLHLQIF